MRPNMLWDRTPGRHRGAATGATGGAGQERRSVAA
jgi:hypothetical protein